MNPLVSMNEQYITTSKAKKILGVHEDTLRGWADKGLFPSIRTPKGTRLYNVSKFIKDQKNECQEVGESYCYCRVSSQGQKDDLQRQIDFMQEQYPNHKIISDIGSGINFKRKGLRTLIEMATKGRVKQIVVAYRDRLCRFAILKLVFAETCAAVVAKFGLSKVAGCRVSLRKVKIPDPVVATYWLIPVFPSTLAVVTNVPCDPKAGTVSVAMSAARVTAAVVVGI